MRTTDFADTPTILCPNLAHEGKKEKNLIINCKHYYPHEYDMLGGHQWGLLLAPFIGVDMDNSLVAATGVDAPYVIT